MTNDTATGRTRRWDLLHQVPGFAEVVASLHDPVCCRQVAASQGLRAVFSWDNRQCLLRYEKETLTFDRVKTTGVARSVVLDCEKKRVVCFSPPKSFAADSFLEKWSPLNVEQTQVEEFVEGTMVNLFWDDQLQDFQLATRSNIGANNTFFQTPAKSFREMFYEAAAANAFSTLCLSREYCYSFVVQHPDNRIVSPVTLPRLILIAVYRLAQQDPFVVEEVPRDSEEVMNMLTTNSRVRVPEQYPVESFTELLDKYADITTPYQVAGAMMTNRRTGERSKVRNPNYEHVRQLRGNHPKLQYQYLCLRKDNRVGQYLKYFPEHKEQILAFGRQVHWFESLLYQHYVDYHITKKTTNILQVPKPCRFHMYELHRQYLLRLRSDKKRVSRETVRQYLLTQVDPAMLMYCINYDLRDAPKETVVGKDDNEPEDGET